MLTINRFIAPFGEIAEEILLERSLAVPLPPASSRVEVELRQAVEADLERIWPLYAADPYLYLGSPDAYRARFDRGEKCFLAMDGDEIAHVNWICFDWGDALPSHPIRLRPDEAYTTDAITPPAYRGNGLHAVVLRAMLEFARERGRTRAYTLSDTRRVDSHKGLRRLGWRPIGRITYFLPKGSERPWFIRRAGDLGPLFRQAGLDQLP